MSIAEHPELASHEALIVNALRSSHRGVAAGLMRLADCADSLERTARLRDAAVLVALHDQDATELSVVESAEDLLRFECALRALEGPQIIAEALGELSCSDDSEAVALGKKMMENLIYENPSLAFLAVTMNVPNSCLSPRQRENIAVRAISEIDARGSLDGVRCGLEDTDWIVDHLRNHSDLSTQSVANICRRVGIQGGGHNCADGVSLAQA